jgi:hypothetical protein
VVKSGTNMEVQTPPANPQDVNKKVAVTVTNKDGVFGLKSEAFTYLNIARPVIDSVVPLKVVAKTPQTITLKEKININASDVVYFVKDGVKANVSSSFIYNQDKLFNAAGAPDMQAGEYQVIVKDNKGIESLPFAGLIYLNKPLITGLDKQEVFEGTPLKITLGKPIIGIDPASKGLVEFVEKVSEKPTKTSATYTDGSIEVNAVTPSGLEVGKEYRLRVTDTYGNASPLSTATVKYSTIDSVKPAIDRVEPRKIVNKSNVIILLKNEIAGLKEEKTIYFVKPDGTTKEVAFTGFTYTPGSKVITGTIDDPSYNKYDLGEFKIRVRGIHGDKDVGDSAVLEYFAGPQDPVFDKTWVTKNDTLKITLKNKIVDLVKDKTVLFEGNKNVALPATYADENGKGVVTVSVPDNMLDDGQKYKVRVTDVNGNNALSTSEITYVKDLATVGVLDPSMGYKGGDDTKVSLSVGRPESIRTVVFTVLDDSQPGKEEIKEMKPDGVVDGKIKVKTPDVSGFHYCKEWRVCQAHVHVVDEFGRAGPKKERAFTFIGRPDEPKIDDKTYVSQSGKKVRMTGSLFDAKNGNVAIFEDTTTSSKKEVDVNIIDAKTFEVEAPGEAPAGQGQVTVSLRYKDTPKSKSASPAKFNYIPEVKDIDIKKGSSIGGDKVIISGNNFRKSVVAFGEKGTTENIQQDNKQITVITKRLPDNFEGSVPVIVRNNGEADQQAVTDKKYAYYLQPVISKITDMGMVEINEAGMNENIFIVGRGFDVNKTKVSLNDKGHDVKFKVLNSSKIMFTMPNNCGNRDLPRQSLSLGIKVVNQDQEMKAARSIVCRPAKLKPEVTEISPISYIPANGGVKVTVTGKNFYKPRIFFAFWITGDPSSPHFTEVTNLAVSRDGSVITFTAPEHYNWRYIPTTAVWMLLHNNNISDHNDKDESIGWTKQIAYSRYDSPQLDLNISEVRAVSEHGNRLPYTFTSTKKVAIKFVMGLQFLNISKVVFRETRTGKTSEITGQDKFTKNGQELVVGVDGSSTFKDMSGLIDVTVYSDISGMGISPVTKFDAFRHISKVKIDKINDNNEIVGDVGSVVSITGENLVSDRVPEIALFQKDRRMTTVSPVEAHPNAVMFKLPPEFAEFENGDVSLRFRSLPGVPGVDEKEAAVEKIVVRYKKRNTIVTAIDTVKNTLDNQNRGDFDGGYEAVISGQGFCKKADGCTVEVAFGSNSVVKYFDYDEKSIRVLVPRNKEINKIGWVPVSVTVKDSAGKPIGKDTKYLGFFYTNQASGPEIDNIVPPAGPMSGGTSVMILGKLLCVDGIRGVRFGENNAVDYSCVVKDGKDVVHVKTPRGSVVGPVDVLITNKRGEIAIKHHGFTYMLSK